MADERRKGVLVAAARTCERDGVDLFHVSFVRR
jgi:hypothetical protein